MKRIFVVLVSLIALSPLFSNGEVESIDKPIVIKVNHTLPQTHPYHKALVKFKEGVESRTEGTIIVEVYESGLLAATETSTLDSVRMGTVDAGLIIGAPQDLALGTDDGLQDMAEMPFMFKDVKAARAAYNGKLGEEYSKLALENGVYVLNYWEAGFRNFTNNIRPIVNPEDLLDIKWRIAPSPIREKTFEALKAPHVTIAFSELFTALQQGAVDGQENPLTIIQANKYYEVQKYLSVSRHIYNSGTLFINLPLWEKFTDTQKAIIQEEADIARDYCFELNDQIVSDSLSFLKNTGMIINEEFNREAFLDGVRPVYDDFVDKYENGQYLIDIAQSYNS